MMENEHIETITIQNATAVTVDIRHPSFSVTVPPNETVNIRREVLQDNDTVMCRYASVRAIEVKEERGFMRKKNGRRQFFVNEHETTFSLVTEFPLKDIQELVLKDDSQPLRVFSLKTLRLRRIVGKTGVQDVQGNYLFPSADSKQLFLKRMRICVWFLPLAFLFILCIVDCLFQKGPDWIGKATVIFFYLAFSTCIFSDTYYYFSAKKWAYYEQ